MKFSDFLVAETIVDNLKSTEKEPAIRELLKVLDDAGKLKPRGYNATLKALLERERLGSTGIGHGVALPHAKNAAVEGLIGAFGRSTGGIEFDALDGDPVHLLFLLLSPPDSTGPHVAALTYISRILKDQTFIKFLKEAKDKNTIVDLLKEADEK